jgi:hypothetical protein
MISTGVFRYRRMRSLKSARVSLWQTVRRNRFMVRRNVAGAARMPRVSAENPCCASDRV